MAENLKGDFLMKKLITLIAIFCSPFAHAYESWTCNATCGISSQTIVSQIDSGATREAYNAFSSYCYSQLHGQVYGPSDTSECNHSYRCVTSQTGEFSTSASGSSYQEAYLNAQHACTAGNQDHHNTCNSYQLNYPKSVSCKKDY